MQGTRPREFPLPPLQLDELGFALEPENWNAAVAEKLAAEAELPGLSEDHWKVIHYLRRYYFQHLKAPSFRETCRDTKLSMRYVYRLFPNHFYPIEAAWKIAGLPRIGEFPTRLE